jgi:sulfatase maturation enzyme AslB (radical SAM superfamily)
MHITQGIHKNRNNIGISFSVDGSKRKHDLQRIKVDGTGSYDDVVKNVPLWLEQFPGASTKATFAHEDLPYLKESIVNIWDLGVKTIYANVVFEDVWHDGDDLIYEQQIRELGDYVLENEMWREHSVSFLNYMNGFSLGIEEDHNYCSFSNTDIFSSSDKKPLPVISLIWFR